jgi:hypothetical protein
MGGRTATAFNLNSANSPEGSAPQHPDKPSACSSSRVVQDAGEGLLDYRFVRPEAI